MAEVEGDAKLEPGRVPLDGAGPRGESNGPDTSEAKDGFLGGGRSSRGDHGQRRDYGSDRASRGYGSDRAPRDYGSDRATMELAEAKGVRQVHAGDKLFG